MFPRFATVITALACFHAPVHAASCGDTAAGFPAWKQAFAQEAARAGIGPRGLQALAATEYAPRTIAADRNQGSFRLSYEAFCEKRGCTAIVAEGKRQKARYPEFYASLERAYGVPSGVIIAIHGMETGFGRFMGNANVLDATATLAYDCRRPDFFKPHLIGALALIDRGSMSPDAVGAMHGELGHTQFLPGNALSYGRDGDGDGRVDLGNMTDALASTAHFLRQKGWRPGEGYLPGTHNYAVLEDWNAASVYQRSLAEMGTRIDG